MSIKDTFDLIFKFFKSTYQKQFKNNGKILAKKYQNFIVIFLLSLSIFVAYIFFFNLNNLQNTSNQKNLNELVKSNGFEKISNYFFDNLNSPYKEYDYVIKNNDSIDLILKKYKIQGSEIKYITTQLKKRKLHNIYTGRKVSLVLKKINDQRMLETFDVLINFLKINEVEKIDLNYNNIHDDRLMPSYFLIKDLKDNIKNNNNLSLFILALISMNNKNWIELHPEHLNLVLESLNLYNQGDLIK